MKKFIGNYYLIVAVRVVLLLGLTIPVWNAEACTLDVEIADTLKVCKLLDETRSYGNLKWLKNKNDIRFRIGGDVRSGTEIGGICISSELIKNRVGVSLGICIQDMFYKTYMNTFDFREQTGCSFIQLYHPSVSDSFSIVDIRESYFIWELPIAISYYLPLGSNFSLVFSTSTYLDFSGKQRFDYVANDASNHREKQHISVGHPVKIFNNLDLSIGIQQEGKRFALQMVAFINGELVKTDYRKREVYYGARLKLFCSISH